MTLVRLAALLAVVAICACDGAISPDPAEPLAPHAEMVSEAPARFALGLGEGAILVDDDAMGLVVLPMGAPTGTIVGRPGEIGDAYGAVEVQDATLLLGSAGLFVLTDGALFPSPLDAHVTGTKVREAALVPRLDAIEPDLFLLADDALYLVRDGTASVVEVEGAELAGAHVGVAIAPGGRALWLATEDAIYEVAVRDGALTAASVRDAPAGVTSMVTDGAGVLWMAAPSGLFTLDGMRRLAQYELPFEPVALHGVPGERDVWITGDGGEVWHWLDGVFRPVDGVPTSGALHADADGALLSASDAGVVRHLARHRVRVLGIMDGERIVDATEITVDTPFADRAVAIEPFIDGEPVGSIDPGGTVAIDPGVLDPGVHELEVRVRYDDGTLPVVRRVVFQVGVDATWNEHVLPIVRARCAACHGEGGSAPTRLDTRDAWEANIETILFNVREGRMPLGMTPLDRDTIALIEAWAASGFPE